MPNSSLTVSFSLASESSSSSVDCPPVLSQEEFEDSVIGVTKSDIIKALEASIFGSSMPDVDCGVIDTTYNSAVVIRPSTTQIGEIGVSHGTLSTQVLTVVTQTDKILFELDIEKNTEFPVDTLISYDWEGDTWDAEGALINPKPSISVSGDTITVSERVYGTVSITYKTEKYTSAVSIPARVDSLNTAFDSVAWVIKDCGVEILVLDPPKTAESDLSNDIDCTGYGSHLTIDSPDDSLSRPEAEPKDITYEYDYCTQLLMAESQYE